MSVVTSEQDILDRHGNRLPPVTSAAKASNSLLMVGVLFGSCRDYVCNRPAVPGDRHRFAPFDRPQKLGQVRLGVGCLYCSHRTSPDQSI